MFKYKILLFGLMVAIVQFACSDSDMNPKCEDNEDCIINYLCNSKGECVKADAVSIKAMSLPKVVVGNDQYKVALEAVDGIEPYSWNMQIKNGAEFLDWLEVVEATGELRAKSGQAPTSTGEGRIEVTVRDSSGGGNGMTSSRLLDIEIVECLGDKICYEVDQDKCRIGLRECSDEGVLGSCVAGDLSTDVNYCGSTCLACDPEKASRCDDGECKCGNILPCEGETTCCAGGCYDLSESKDHCGACGNECNEAEMHVVSAKCESEECDYNECEDDNLDCDTERKNGCETARQVTNCADCDDDCTNTEIYINTENPGCESGECTHDCIEGFGDCEIGEKGCETTLWTEENCSDCLDECNDPYFPVCMEGESGWKCGCSEYADCDEKMMCCDELCIEHSDLNCTDCDDKCTMEKGGVECTKDEDDWKCGCTDDSICRGAYEFSKALCASQCFCDNISTNCAGTKEDICCIVDDSPGCTNLLDDKYNCGVCGRECKSDEYCTNGYCTCEQNKECPNLSNEVWKCDNYICVCPGYSDHPCPPGQYCCDGEEGGCCMKSCVSATKNDCSGMCNDVWCFWGCCEDCESVDECEANQPADFPFQEY